MNWQFPRPDKPVAEATSPPKTARGIPSWFEETRLDALAFDATPHHSVSKSQQHWAKRNAARKEVCAARERISKTLATTASPRLQATDWHYRNWLVDTADPSIQIFHNSIDAEHSRILSQGNAGGTLESYFEAAGQAAACRMGMAATLLLKETHCEDLPAAFERIKQEMAAFATAKAAELSTIAHAEQQFGRLMASANRRAEEWTRQRMEKESINRQIQAKREEDKQLAKEKQKQKTAVQESGFVTSSPKDSSSYKR